MASNTLYLVCASGGIDSGLTAHILKKIGEDVIFCHFKYGQRSQEQEEWAIKKLSETLDIPLVIFDISHLYQQMNAEKVSFLMDKNAKIYSGLKRYKKSTAAWVPGRNMLFATILMTYAESLLLQSEGKYQEVKIAAGWAQLSESGSYPDNSERFNKACEKLAMFGTLFPSRIKMCNILSRIMKYEEWILGYLLNFPFEYTCSCDNPRFRYDSNDNIVGLELCVECGSTQNSRWAAIRAGVKDPRHFYESKQHPEGEDAYKIDVEPICKNLEEMKERAYDIVDRLEIPDEGKEILKLLIRHR